MSLLRKCGGIIQNKLIKTVKLCRKCHRSAYIRDESIWASNPDPKYTEVEEVKGHWHYVEKLIAKKVIIPPAPTNIKHISVGGWRPPPDTAPDLPYFIERTRNYLLPVYKRVILQGPHYITEVKRIKGDIWILADDLRQYLQPFSKFKLRMRVDEIAGHIEIRDDHEDRIKEWLYDKGF